MVMSNTDARTRQPQHLSEEDCVDFVRGQVPAPERVLLQGHLEDGCRKCAKAIRLWKAVFAVADHEATYRLPDQALRQARGAFALRRPPRLLDRMASGVALVFDSLRQPLAAGVRAAGASPRQLLYKAGRYTIRLRLEPSEDSERTFIVGQILDELDPTGPLQDIAVLALKGSKTLDRTLTNQMGEFLLEPASAGDLQLCVGVAEIGTFTVQPGTGTEDVSLGATTRGLGGSGRRGRARQR
jgi:hypothetical protein